VSLQVPSLKIMRPLQYSSFQLDSSGVAGFFGGDETVRAMATVHIYEGRKWLGWFNSPGSYTVAKKYGQLSNSRFWRGLFPGVTVDPSTLFEWNGSVGPEFFGLHSGTVLKNTGRTGYLMIQECKDMKSVVLEGRETSPGFVTIAMLDSTPDTRVYPKLLRSTGSLLAIIPISCSLACCAMCGVYRDWYCFLMILLGIVTSGLSCYVIGRGKLSFIHPRPADGSPPGDGILKEGMDMVILKGDEGAVNSITRGEFSLEFASQPEYRDIGICSMLLIVQFLAQLLLIPQGTLFGQVMFLSTLAVSWAYNSYLSSLDNEMLQRELLLNCVLAKPRLQRFKFPNWTSTVVFTLLFGRPDDPQKMLNSLIPNDTIIWGKWKAAVLGMVETRVSDFVEDYAGLENVKDSLLLKQLYGDARSAYEAYKRHERTDTPLLSTETKPSTQLSKVV
jgi:hypothetical protein